MKIISIIFCILTIVMLSALAVSIIKNDDASTSNKEKRYIIIYLFGFIVLMISSIFSTLGKNIISMILFAAFIALVLLATLILLQCKKNNDKVSKKKLVPNKLKKNLKILKESSDGYTYEVQTTLTCCDDEFEVQSIKEDDLHIVHCVCTKCHTEYEVYNSELDGYKLFDQNDIKFIKQEFNNQECSKCNGTHYNVEITYGYMDYLDDMKEIKECGVKDKTNLYSSMKMNITCVDCNKKEKDFVDYEYR